MRPSLRRKNDEVWRVAVTVSDKLLAADVVSKRKTASVEALRNAVKANLGNAIEVKNRKVPGYSDMFGADVKVKPVIADPEF